MGGAVVRRAGVCACGGKGGAPGLETRKHPDHPGGKAEADGLRDRADAERHADAPDVEAGDDERDAALYEPAATAREDAEGLGRYLCPGATMFDLLAGKPPLFRGDIAGQIKGGQAPSVAERRAEQGAPVVAIPEVWEKTLALCLSKNPEKRPPDAATVWGLLTGKSKWVPESVSSALAYPRSDAVLVPAAQVGAAKGLLWSGLVTFVAVVVAGWWWRGRAPEQPLAEQVEAVGGFVVEVDPTESGARLWIGPVTNVEVPINGRAEVRNLPDGEHELVVQAPGYQPLTTRVTVKDGRGQVQAKLVPVRGALAVTARPGTAVTAVDARGRKTQLGTVPQDGLLTVTNLLMIGTYQIEFVQPDCETLVTGGVEIMVGRTTKIGPVQQPLPGELRIFSMPTSAAVMVNGKRIGVTPLTTVQPSEVTLSVEVFERGYRRSTEKVTLKPSEVRSINVGTLVAENGGLELRFANIDELSGRPIVKIDGRAVEPRGSFVGQVSTSSARITGLEVGRHIVEVSHRDFEPWHQEVTVRDEEVTMIGVRLELKPGRLSVRTKVKGVKLTVNERALQPEEWSSGVLVLPAGVVQTIVASATGYEPMIRTLTLAPNGSEKWEISLEELTQPTVGQRWTIPRIGLTLVPIVPGSFNMGSANGDHDEKPITRVSITKAFWLGKTEVTQEQWAMVMAGNPSKFRGAKLPVEQVSWPEATEFCRKLTARERADGRLPEGYEYSLPTEAQWEYACRARTTGDYAGEIKDMVAARIGQTREVGIKKSNHWELYDMHGNVWEWCKDWYGAYPGGNISDPKGAATGSLRVARGGSWLNPGTFWRSANRVGWELDDRSPNLGFRLALTATR